MTENDAISELEKFQIQVEHSIAEEERCEYDNLEKALQEHKEFLEAFDMAISPLKEVQQYREIGTVEECREAVDKQKQKKPKIHKDRFSNTYNCPKCSYVLIHRDETGWFCGQHYKFCPGCGQAIQWKESEEE